MENIKDKVAIIGMGCARFGERWDAGLDDLAIEAAYEAYEDAGIDPKDIQACWFGTVTAPAIGIGGTHATNSLKLDRIPVTRVENWCATGHEALRNACFGVA
ncbi:MAG: acetyl-CoA acetyltransferase, partial [Chloroflexi bacterium]|nr:acetyl-CoA acetyltransferase [Chloroflexota bacterium]